MKEGRRPTAGYSGTPLAKKLGVKPGQRIALIDAPPGFEETLGPIPDDVVIRHQARGARDLTIWFVQKRRALEMRIEAIGARVETGGLWIAWPKKASGVVTDVSDSVVRAAGLAHGLVDHKVCAIDLTWSGLKFAKRKS